MRTFSTNSQRHRNVNTGQQGEKRECQTSARWSYSVITPHAEGRQGAVRIKLLSIPSGPLACSHVYLIAANSSLIAGVFSFFKAFASI